MSGILRLESLTKGNTLKQGDKTPLKYRLFDADGENLNIAGKSAKVRLVYPDFLTIGYEKDGLTVAQDDTVTFTIDSVIPSRIYHVEIIVDDKFIFPSRADEAKFTVDKSSLGTDSSVIEIIGKDALISEVKSQVDTELQPLVTYLEASEQAELERVQAENERSVKYESYAQQFNDVITDLSEEKDYHSLPEISAARGGHDTLGQRLDETTAQLAHNTQVVNDAVSKVTADSEVILARDGKTTLGVRLDEIETGKGLNLESISSDKTNFIQTGKNRFNKDDVVPGYLSGNGNVVHNTTVSTSNFIPVVEGETLHRPEYTNQLAFYNADHTLNSFLGYGTQSSGVITVPSGARYLRVTLANSWLNTYQLESGSQYTTYEPFSLWFKNPPQKIIDSQALAPSSVLDSHIVNKEAGLIFDGAINYLTINFIDQTITIPAGTYLSTNLGVTTIPAQTIDIKDYLSNTYKLCINRITKEFSVKQKSINSTDFNEYSLLNFYYPGSSVSSSNPYLSIRRNGVRTRNIIDETSTNNPYSGQKIVFYGDSITNNPARLQLISDNLGFAFHLNLGWSDSAVTMEDKLAWVNPTTGVFMGNPAAGGQQPTGSVAVQSSFCRDERIAYIPTDANVVFIMGGTNDLFRNKPKGDLTTDNTTFTGALIETIKKIQLRVPNALIVVATPIIALSGAGADTPKVNYGGLTILDYVKQVEEVVDYTGVAFSDVHNCGINLFNAKDILPDGVHPSTPKGTELISRKIVGDMRAIAPL